MGLESHVNDVLDDAGFKRSDWYWSDGLRWSDRTVAQKIVKTLNSSGHFGRAKILPGASKRIVFGVYRPTGRSYVAGDTHSGGGGKRRSGSKRRHGKLPPCDKCGEPNQIHEWSNYCSACHEGYQARVARDPETAPIGSRLHKERYRVAGGKKRHAPSKSKLGGLVADINRLVK